MGLLPRGTDDTQRCVTPMNADSRPDLPHGIVRMSVHPRACLAATEGAARFLGEELRGGLNPAFTPFARMRPEFVARL